MGARHVHGSWQRAVGVGEAAYVEAEVTVNTGEVTVVSHWIVSTEYLPPVFSEAPPLSPPLSGTRSRREPVGGVMVRLRAP